MNGGVASSRNYQPRKYVNQSPNQNQFLDVNSKGFRTVKSSRGNSKDPNQQFQMFPQRNHTTQTSPEVMGRLTGVFTGNFQSPTNYTEEVSPEMSNRIGKKRLSVFKYNELIKSSKSIQNAKAQIELTEKLQRKQRVQKLKEEGKYVDENLQTPIHRDYSLYGGTPFNQRLGVDNMNTQEEATTFSTKIMKSSNSTIKENPMEKSSNPIVHTLEVKKNQLQEMNSSRQPNPGNTIIGEFFPDMQKKMELFEDQKQKRIMTKTEKRIDEFQKAFKSMNDRQKTFEKFGFKTIEKQENIQLKPVIKEFTGGDAKGTMSISDLWSDKNIKKYLHDCKLVKDKITLKKIAQIKSRQQQASQKDKPVLMNRKEEQHLISRVYMSKDYQEWKKKQTNKLIGPSLVKSQQEQQEKQYQKKYVLPKTSRNSKKLESTVGFLKNILESQKTQDMDRKRISQSTFNLHNFIESLNSQIKEQKRNSKKSTNSMNFEGQNNTNRQFQSASNLDDEDDYLSESENQENQGHSGGQNSGHRKEGKNAKFYYRKVNNLLQKMDDLNTENKEDYLQVSEHIDKVKKRILDRKLYIPQIIQNINV